MERVSSQEESRLRLGSDARPSECCHTADANAAHKIKKGYDDHQSKWAESGKRKQRTGRGLEGEVKLAELRANHFDLAEALLEDRLVITSITLLTRSRAYWYIGIVFSVIALRRRCPYAVAEVSKRKRCYSPHSRRASMVCALALTWEVVRRRRPPESRPCGKLGGLGRSWSRKIPRSTATTGLT